MENSEIIFLLSILLTAQAIVIGLCLFIIAGFKDELDHELSDEQQEFWDFMELLDAK